MTLASAIEKAREASVPNDNIERAIKRGTGELEGGARYEEVTYEGYGPGGVAVFVETLTDNRNRTAQDVRHAFTRSGGNLGENGSTAWMFARKGSDPDREGPGARRGAAARDRARGRRRRPERRREHVGDHDRPDGVRARCADAIEAAGIPMLSAELTMLPQTTVPVEGGQAKQVLALLEALEELDDVQNVYANFDIPESVMAELG